MTSDLTEWRRHLHSIPELAYRETKTAQFIAARLRELGLPVHTGLAGTGIVATVEGRGGPGMAIGLRADMDALPITEATGLPYASRNAGVMHACGHDGHMAMLLGAAQRLAAEPDFRGQVHLIFQPAEENEGGGRRIVEDGLFDHFPCRRVFGLHNWPGLPEGSVAIRRGILMAADHRFTINFTGPKIGVHFTHPPKSFPF